MMRRASLSLTAARTLRWSEDTLNSPAADEVLVRTLYGAVSLGTELPLYLGSSRGSTSPAYPRMTGYESYGVVVACGTGVTGFKPGDRVVGFYGHRSHALEPQSRLIPTPRDLDPRLALLAILSCDVKKGILEAAPRPGEAVLITGAGAIGLLTLFVLRALGTADVDVVEPQEARRVLARRLGARTVFEVGSGISECYPVGFECSSRNAAFTLLQAQLAPQGRLCVLSDGNLEPLVLESGFHEKELRVLGSSDGHDYLGHAAWFYDLEGLEALKALFELEVSAPDLPQAFADMSSAALRPVKALVRYTA